MKPEELADKLVSPTAVASVASRVSIAIETIMANERERCAKLADELAATKDDGGDAAFWAKAYGSELAAKIRGLK